MSASAKTSTTERYRNILLFIQEVKTHFAHSPSDYNRFVSILTTYQTNISTRKKERAKLKSDLYSDISNLFGANNDLTDGFSSFYPNIKFVVSSGLLTCQNCAESLQKCLATKFLQPQRDHRQQLMDLWTGKYGFASKTTKNAAKRLKVIDTPKLMVPQTSSCPLFSAVKYSLHNKSLYEHFLRHIVLYMDGVINYKLLMRQITRILGGFPLLLRQFKDIVNSWGVKEDEESEEEVDSCPSYKRRINKLYDSSLCNSIYVCSAAHEDDRRSCQKKNYYEEQFSKCEEERFELDLLLDSIRDGVVALRKLQTLQTPMDNFEDLSLIRGLIHRVYKESSSVVFDNMKKNPPEVIPILVERMIEVRDEGLKRRDRMRDRWMTVQGRTFLRASDYRGSHFKNANLEGISLRGEEEIMDYSDDGVLGHVMDLLLYHVDNLRGRGTRLGLNLRGLVSHLLKKGRIFYGNSHWYSFWRVHNILYGRLMKLQSLAARAGSELTAEDSYVLAIDYVKRLLARDVDPGAFEEAIRETVGVEGYFLFTIDRVVTLIFKHLGRAVDSEASGNFIGLYRRFGRTDYYEFASTAKSSAYKFEFRHDPTCLVVKSVPRNDETVVVKKKRFKVVYLTPFVMKNMRNVKKRILRDYSTLQDYVHCEVVFFDGEPRIRRSFGFYHPSRFESRAQMNDEWVSRRKVDDCWFLKIVQ